MNAALLTRLAWLGALAAWPAGAQERERTADVVPVLIGASGSLGRGSESARLVLAQARSAGVEAIFWTASESLLAAGREVTSFSLDAAEEPLDAGEDWKASPVELGEEKRVVVQALRGLTRGERALGGDSSVSEHAFDREDSRDGTPSLRLTFGGSNTEVYRSLAVQLLADRNAQRRSLALDVRARFFVLPIEQSSDGRAFAEFRLSQQNLGPRARTTAPDVLHYYLSNGAEPVTASGGTIFIPVPFEPGVWNELVLDLSADARAHTLGGPDNVLYQLRLGVESRFQAPCAARFDQFSLEKGLSGAAGLARQAEVLQGLGDELELAPAWLFLGLCSDALRGATLFELGASVVPTDYRPLLEQERATEPGRDPAALAELVAAARRRGSLVVHGNPLAAPHNAPELGAARLAGLLEGRLSGADLLLFDQRPDTFPRQLELWDGLARGGLYPLGLGSGGLLGGERSPLVFGAQGLVNLVLAASSDQAELLESLARGRTAFGDPAVFLGGLDLESERGFKMGQVVLTDRATASISLKRLGPPAAGEEVDWLTSRGRVSSFESATPSPVVLEELPDFARAVVLGARVQPVAFSNALHFVRAFPAGGLPAERAAFDLADVRCFGGAGLRLLDARVTEDGRGVEITGQASGAGTLQLALGSGDPAAVTWSGLRGVAEQDGASLRLDELSGEGSLTVRSAP